MSDSKCPDKLEPQYLTSVLKNVPVDIMWELRKYHSKPSHFDIKWRARQPVEGKKFGWGGDLKWEDARSGDMYVRDRSLEQKYHHLQDVNRNLTSNLVEATRNYTDLSAEYEKNILDAEDWKARHKDLIMLREVNKPAIREECDGRDYDAVTKGVISLINLLRR
jgi:hypothetical protein